MARHDWKGRGRAARLLLVEDDEQIGAMFRLGLERAGFDVLLARNGALGIDAVRSRRPDLVLLDIAMPVMDGYRMLRALRADPELANIKVVVLSNFSEAALREQCLAAGALDFVLKVSVAPAELAQHIARWLVDPEVGP